MGSVLWKLIPSGAPPRGLNRRIIIKGSGLLKQQEKVGLSSDFVTFCFQACKPLHKEGKRDESGASCTTLCEYGQTKEDRYKPGECKYVPSDNDGALDDGAPEIPRGCCGTEYFLGGSRLFTLKGILWWVVTYEFCFLV